MGNRHQNEKKFGQWRILSDGGRRYWLVVHGRNGWTASYVKEVDRNEVTIRFFQEIRNDKGILVEIHEKFPKDKGHIKLDGKS